MIVKFFHSCTKPVVNDSEIDEAFKSMHQSIMAKIKNYVDKNWFVLDVIINLSIRFLGISVRKKVGVTSDFKQIKILFYRK